MASSFEPRSLINGGMLRDFSGKLISIMLRLETIAGSITTMSTDKHTVRVSLQEPLNARKGDWLEVIGNPVGSDAVNAKEVIVFREDEIDFDEDGYNMMVQFMNNCKDIYRQG